MEKPIPDYSTLALPEPKDIAISLFRLGEEMYSLFILQGGLTNEFAHIEDQISMRKLDLTPAEGWEGKNEEQRTIAKEKVFQGDETLKALLEKRYLKKEDIVTVSAYLEALKDRRRGLEWAARITLIPFEREDREYHPTPPF